MVYFVYKGVWYIIGLVNFEVFKYDIIYNIFIDNFGVFIFFIFFVEGNGDDDCIGNFIFVCFVNL